MIFKLLRRKKLTLVKCILIGFTVTGVMFWYNQVWNIPLPSDEFPEKNAPAINLFHSPKQKRGDGILVENQIDNKEQGIKNIPSKEFSISLKQNEGKGARYSDHKNILRVLSDKKNSKKTKVPQLYFYDRHMKVTPGLGENGVPVNLSPKEQKLADELFNGAAFNVYLSDRISLNRSVPDPRSTLCKDVKYDANLPTASVIIIFTNEAWSALLRTIYSVINRSPSRFLHEIILVDDFSDKDELKYELKSYIQHHFSRSLVKLIRLTERQGLIRTRLAGAREATGDVLVFLDSHCEVNNLWLEPLLQRIKEDRKAVLCPIIDVIDDKTLEYYASNRDYFQIGGFTWSGHFTWIEIPKWEEERRKSPIAPTRSPTMAGGLFAIDRSYFWEVGSYDSGMDIWGGENLEMSFRVWMCGGSLEVIPCSHVGHIFRSFHPYTFPGNKDTHGINTVRTVEVWMGEYKKYFYMFRQDLLDIDFGEVAERFQLQEKLDCKPFSWFLSNVYPQKFIIDQNVSAYGIVKNPISNLCLDILNKDEDKTEPLGYYPCKQQKIVVMNQMFSLSLKGELRREENCAEVESDSHKLKLKVLMTKCASNGISDSNQKWMHTTGGPIIHVRTGKCLDTANSKMLDDVYVTACKDIHSQIWWFENYKDMTLEVQRSAS